MLTDLQKKTLPELKAEAEKQGLTKEYVRAWGNLSRRSTWIDALSNHYRNKEVAEKLSKNPLEDGDRSDVEQARETVKQMADAICGTANEDGDRSEPPLDLLDLSEEDNLLNLPIKAFNKYQLLRQADGIKPLLCQCKVEPCHYTREEGDAAELSECESCGRLIPWCYMGDGDELCNHCWGKNRESCNHCWGEKNRNVAENPPGVDSVQNQGLTLTLWQPWATLVALGIKKFETRSWGTSHRGQLLIHASSRPMKEAELILLNELHNMGIDLPPKEQFPLGAIVARCDLTACRTMTESKDCNPLHQIYTGSVSELDRKVGNWQPGRFAWKLENIQPLHIPNVKGKQGLWRYSPSAFIPNPKPTPTPTPPPEPEEDPDTEIDPSPAMIRPFSNGSEYEDWASSNCYQCQKSNPDLSPTCEIDEALLIACFGDGLIEKSIHQRMNYGGKCSEFESAHKLEAASCT